MSIESILTTFKGLTVGNVEGLKDFRLTLRSYVCLNLQEKRLVRTLKRRVNSMINDSGRRGEKITDLVNSTPVKWLGVERSLIDFEWRRLITLAKKFNFSLSDTSEYVSDDENFTKLNIGPGHPGREEHGYFDVNRGQFLLRSHSTANHFKDDWYDNPSRRMLSLGRVYRNDRDSTHLSAFHQVEVLIKQNMTLQSFLTLLKDFLSTFLAREIEVKIRPSYFPFTYLSFEIDIGCEGRIYEVAGAGIMMPNVVSHEDRKWPALAFGFERLLMIKYRFHDIKDCYSIFNVENVS